MSAPLLSKILGFVLLGVFAVSWWFIQQQIALNAKMDERLDVDESHILMDEDHITSLQKQLHGLRLQVEERK